MTGGQLVHVLVCGEPLRGDDGVAIMAVRRLPEEVAALATVTEVGQLSVETLLAIPPDIPVIVVDAAAGIPPGQVVCLPLAAVTASGDPDSASGVTPASSHAMPAGEVLALADELRGRPLEGRFIGLGGTAFGFGNELSAATADGVAAFVSTIESEIRRLAVGTSASTGPNLTEQPASPSGWTSRADSG